MKGKRVIRTLISLALLVALVAVIITSQKNDSSNPHSSIPRETFIYGPKGHGYTVNNNQQPWKQCYTCHEEQGLGGESYCQSCHVQSGRDNIVLPKKP